MSVVGEPERAAARILAEMQAKFGHLETLRHLVLLRNKDEQPSIAYCAEGFWLRRFERRHADADEG